MNTTLKRSFISKIFLKAAALILGFLFWSIMSDSFIATRWVTVPVCFYNIKRETLKAPETILVELRGKRAHLKHLDSTSIAVHIDAQTLNTGVNTLQVDTRALLLPPSIAVGDTIPHVLSITKLTGTDHE